MKNRMLKIIGVICIMAGWMFAIDGIDPSILGLSHVQANYENMAQDVAPGGGGPDYDALTSSGEWVNPYFNSSDSRNTADTMSYCPSIAGQFVFVPGDYMLTMYQMPADGFITGVNVPVFEWADDTETSGDGLEVTLWKLNYPDGSDGNPYSTDDVDGGGWMGYAWDGADHTSAGIEGSDWYGDGADETGLCGAATAIPNVLDPLAELIWPTGFSQATFGPGQVTAQDDNWLNTADFGSQPELLQGDWVGILVENQGTMVEYSGFYYCEGSGVVDPWTFAKFYATECDGTSGETGWHVRHWVVHWPLAVELTGDRAPIISDVSALPTTLSTADRMVTATITDDNPSGGPAGVASASVNYSTDSGATWESAELTADGDTYSGSIPGQSAGTAVSWYLSATDVEGGMTETVANTYNIFEAIEDNLFLYNSSLYGGWISIYYNWGILDTNFAYDIWSYGAAGTELFNEYATIMEVSGGGPDWCNDYDALGSWLDSGNKRFISAGDEWMGACVDGWAPTTFAPGEFVYDHLGIAASYPDVNYAGAGDQNGISRLMAVADDPISGDLATFLSDSLNLNYDPVYEIGAANWLDGADAVAGTNVAYTGYGGVLDSSGNTTSEDVYNTALYTEYSNGSKTAWFGFDVLSLNTTPSYYWIGVDPIGPLPKTLSWMGPGELSIEDNNIIPEDFVLHQNYPNPFNPTTNIRFEVPVITDVNLSIYNTLGQEVAELVNGEMKLGTYNVQWNGTDQLGNIVASGVYFYRLTAGEIAKTGKMLLLK